MSVMNVIWIIGFVAALNAPKGHTLPVLDMGHPFRERAPCVAKAHALNRAAEAAAPHGDPLKYAKCRAWVGASTEFGIPDQDRRFYDDGDI
jgi:hypothetical protein